MFGRLDAIVLRFEKISQLLSDSKITSNINEFKELSKEFSSLEKLVSKYKEYRELVEQIADLNNMSNDDDKEFAALASKEADELSERLPVLEEELKLLLIP